MGLNKESGKLCWVGLFRFSTGHIPTYVQSEQPASSPHLRCVLLLLKPPFLCATIDIKYLNKQTTTAVSNQEKTSNYKDFEK